MKSLESRLFPHPRPPHAEILNSRRVFFAAQTTFETVPSGEKKIISHNFNELDVGWP
ncbi:hypothetical protein [Agrobacterium pusense]|uniref:hypothetical protein n=1 Tax=Agrobacterium pusense TaxID=648995 RepID=UPI00289767FC|nr:hypothetical protein [Agrobacterium pusense]